MASETGTGRLVAGRYSVTGVLGRGGMGVVWDATDEVLNRPVALKEVQFPAHLTDEERADLRARTLREARTAARLVHPCVTTLYDVVEEDGRPWLVMERVESRSLQEVVQRSGPLPWRTAARIALDVLDALEAAHSAGVVHRDGRPGSGPRGPPRARRPPRAGGGALRRDRPPRRETGQRSRRRRLLGAPHRLRHRDGDRGRLDHHVGRHPRLAGLHHARPRRA